MSSALRIARGAFGRVVLLDMDQSAVRHAHPHCHVLLKVEGADTQFMVGDSIVPLSDTTVVLVNGWEPHAYMHDPARSKTLMLALYIEPKWLDLFRVGWAASGGPGFFERPCGEISPRTRNLALDLAASMMSRPDAHREHEARLSDLMVEVVERFASSIRQLGTLSRVDWRIRRAIDLARVNPGEGLCIDRLACQAGLSRAHFFRLFQSSLGMSPRIFFNVIRMEAAVAAVVDDDESFASVSDRLGFSAPAHFTRFFRNHAGDAPREFRKVARLA